MALRTPCCIRLASFIWWLCVMLVQDQTNISLRIQFGKSEKVAIQTISLKIVSFIKNRKRCVHWSGEFILSASSAMFSLTETSSSASRFAIIVLICSMACPFDLALPIPIEAVKPTICKHPVFYKLFSKSNWIFTLVKLVPVEECVHFLHLVSGHGMGSTFCRRNARHNSGDIHQRWWGRTKWYSAVYHPLRLSASELLWQRCRIYK